jgi:tyrosyl-tRNA synthetase
MIDGVDMATGSIGVSMAEPDVRAGLLAGAAEVVPADEFDSKLELGRPLRVKLGLDPTAESVTLGWAVVLHKLRQFQDAGHTAVLIVGDYTARVGDPSGKSETRPQLDAEVVRGYADALVEQFWRILDANRTEVRFNSEWLEPLGMEGVLRLAASTTVARMLERDDFAKRFAQAQPISILEFLYPLLQGYDSVAVGADIELGGKDQLFNLLMGRDLQRDAGQEPQVALTMPLLVGTDGVHKMSQSLGNYIAITDSPDEMFGKLVRVSDELTAEYRRLAVDFFTDPAEAERVASGLANGSLDPWHEKRRMAAQIVDLYHGHGSGAAASERFDRIHREHEVPSDVEVVPIPDEAITDGMVFLPVLLVRLGFMSSNSEARRKIAEGGVRLDNETVWAQEVPVDEVRRRVISFGRRRFVRLV